MSKIIIRNEDCRKTIKHMIDKGIKADCVLTSPPYNISRKVNEKRLNNYERKYKKYNDSMNNQEYVKFITHILDGCERILNKNGAIICNISYSSDLHSNNSASNLIYLINCIVQNTSLVLADIICWKKSNAIPNNVSKNKLTRICEYVFIFVREKEFSTFNSNKEVINISKSGQKVYSNLYNYIEAKNNDGKNPYNNATFSSEFVQKLLQMYVKDNSIVYDCFGGTGTTAIGCIKEDRNISCILSEIDEEQCEYAKKRIKECEDI